MELIRLTDVRKSFDLGAVRIEVLRGASLAVDQGEMAAVVGASGCGKSTLMNIIGLLDSPSQGSYVFQGRDVSAMTDRELSALRNRSIGFVFQQFHLLPRLTALENVCLPLVYRGTPEKERLAVARDMLARVGMADRQGHRPAQLSGGQQQRVAIARALAGRPSLILADEPTGALDTAVGQDIMNLFLELNRETVTILVITHDPGVARQCPRQFRMLDGRVVGERTAPAAGDEP